MRCKVSVLLVCLAAVACCAVLLAGCGKRSADQSGGAADITINGAGATFPYPVYARWAHKYQELTGVKVNYQSIGSGGGVQQIKAGTVDFGASDAPLTAEELEEFGLVQFPMVMGGVVPVVNLPGVRSGTVRLSGEVLADVFLGKVTKWNDPRIAAENPGVKLPNRDITVVHRADGSGTTWIFTNYLDKVSQKWHKDISFGKAVSWPVGVGGKGNEGVAAYVQRVKGAVGYVEYAYAIQNNLPFIELKNRAGNYVEPSIETFQSAAANADWRNAPGYYMVLTDQPGEKSWPITGASYIILRKEQDDADLTKAMLDFFDWCYDHGSDMAEELHYVPMPENVVKLAEDLWREELTSPDGPVWE